MWKLFDLYKKQQHDRHYNERFPVEDPLDARGLPADWWATELNYSTQRLSPAAETRISAWTFVVAALIGLALSVFAIVFAEFIGDSELLPPLMLIAFVSATALFAFHGSKTTKHIPQVIVAILGLWLFCYLATTQTGFFVFAFAFAVFLADQVALHYAYWRTAPPVPREQAQQIQLSYRNRFRRGEYLLRLALVPVLLLLAAQLATAFFHGRPSLTNHARPLSILVAGATLVLLPFAFGFIYGRRLDPTAMVAGTWQGIVSFLTYNQHQSLAPGMFHSPAGLFPQRHLVAVLCLVAISVAILPYADYFPTGSVPDEAFDWYAATSIKPAFDPKLPLSAKEQETLHAMRMNRVPRSELLDAIRQWGHAGSEDILQRAFPKATYPGNWILHAFYNSRDNSASLYPVSVSFLLTLFVPAAFFFITCVAVAGMENATVYLATDKHFAYHQGSNPTFNPHVQEATKSEQAAQTKETAERWDEIIKRIIFSDGQLKDHLYVGRNVVTDQPILVHRDLFKQHAHILGGSGKGKTSLSLAPLITQLIRAGDCNVVIFDQKADPHDRSLFWCAQIEATKSQPRPEGRPERLTFKHFTTRLDWQTHLCNPLLESPHTHLTSNQRAEMLCQAMGLTYGPQYGESYFSDMNAAMANDVIREEMAQDFQLKRPINFQLIAKKTHDSLKERKKKSPAEQDIQKASTHFWATLQKFASIPTINHLPDHTEHELHEGAINFDDLFDDSLAPQVYFFEMPGIIDAETAGGLARFFLFRILHAATAARVRPERPTFIVIDEFQIVAAPNFARLLELARSAGIGFILSNQSLAAIEGRGGSELVHSIFTNTEYRQVFDVTSPDEAATILKRCGEYFARNEKVSFSEDALTGIRRSKTRHLEFAREGRVSATDLLVMSATERQSLVFCGMPRGYTRYNNLPVLAESDFHISTEEFRDRKDKLGPPPQTPSTISAVDFHKHTSSWAVQPDTPIPPHSPDEEWGDSELPDNNPRM